MGGDDDGGGDDGDGDASAGRPETSWPLRGSGRSTMTPPLRWPAAGTAALTAARAGRSGSGGEVPWGMGGRGRDAGSARPR